MIKKFMLATWAVATLGACTSPVTPDFTEMSANYASILEQYQLNSILINIIRASNERPLSFLDIPSINGSGNVTTSPSLSGSLNGFIGGLAGGATGLSSINPSLSLSFGNSFNFSQSSLDNATFIRGFMAPISIENARLFISDNIPREVIFSMIIASIEIRHPDGTVDKFINNPLLPDHPAFQKEMYRLLSYGLTVDQVQRQAPKFPEEQYRGGGQRPINSGRMPSSPYEPSHYPMGGYGGYGGNPYGMNLFGQAQSPYQFKVCVDQNRFSDYVKQEFGNDIFCKSPLTAADSKSKKSELVLNLRSANNVFDYLGQVVAAQNQTNPYFVALPPSDTTSPRKQGQKNQYALLVVAKDNSGGKSFASVKNLDGDIYSIPSQDNGYSPTVIKIISQLLSLNKIPGSIPTSPAVLIR